MCYHRWSYNFSMTDFPKFDDEYVDRLEVSITSRNFKIYGSDGAVKDLRCDTVDEFMRILEVSKMAKEIDSEIEMVYV